MNKEINVLSVVRDTGWGDVGAEIELKENGERIGIVFVSYEPNDIEIEIGINDLFSLKENEIKNAIAVFTIRDFDKLKKLPKLSMFSKTTQRLYDSVELNIDIQQDIMCVIEGCIELTDEVKNDLLQYYNKWGEITGCCDMSEFYGEFVDSEFADETNLVCADYMFLTWFVDDRKENN